VIKVANLKMVEVKGKTLCMLMDPIQILVQNLTEKLGAPQDIAEIAKNQSSFELDKQIEIPSSQKEEKIEVDIPETKVAETAANTKAKYQAPSPVKAASPVKQQPVLQDSSDNNSYMPIKAVNTFTRDWVIKARISNKGPLKTTKKGGYLLKIEMVDHHGSQIEGTFFNKPAERFNSLLQQDKVYLFSNGQVRMANKKFSSLNNDFCIIFDEPANIQEAADDGSITQQAFEFKTIQEVGDAIQIKSADVIGIVTMVGEQESIKLKSGEEKTRKSVQIADQSGCSINLTLWGTEFCTKNEALRVGQVLAVKQARVSEFGGKSLNVASDHAGLYPDIKIPEAEKVLAWWRQNSDSSLN